MKTLNKQSPSIRVIWADQHYAGQAYALIEKAVEQICSPHDTQCSQASVRNTLTSAFSKKGVYQVFVSQHIETFIALDEHNKALGVGASFEGDILLHCVYPDAQGRGVGDALLSCMKQFAMHGIMRVQCPLVSTSYYAKRGFIMLGEVSGSAGVLFELAKKTCAENSQAPCNDWLKNCFPAPQEMRET